MKKILFKIADSIKGFFINIFTSRPLTLAFIFFILFIIIFCRLFYLQVIKSDYYSDNFTQKSEKTIYKSGARGNIYDCNGNILAHNEIGYSVYMTDIIPSSDEKGDIINNIIYKTINIIEENGDSITEDFNIELDKNGNYSFKSDPITKQITFLCNVFGLSSDEIYEKGYDKYTAEEVMDYICSEDRFDISDSYTPAERVKIGTVRYALSLNSYQKYVETEIATNINDATRAAISENKSDLTGVKVNEYYKRVYDEGEYVASLIGYTGEISEEELKEYNTDNDAGITYSQGDYVGKAGLEKSMDSYLQGEKGQDIVFVDAKGNVIETVSSTESGSGNDLYLSIDINLQKAAYELLKREIAGILLSKLVNYDYEPYENAEQIYIPIKDVYYKLLTNVIDITAFEDSDASEREKATLSAFKERQSAVITEIKKQLEDVLTVPVNQLSEEYNEYMYFIYDYMGELGILNKDLIDTSNEIYEKWANEEISLREFIMGAISENWINANALGKDVKFADSNQIYNSIVETVISGLKDNKDFAKKIYYYMVYDETISGRDICLMLYDQEKLPEDDDLKARLESGDIEPFSYVYIQVENLVITPAMIALDPCSGSLVVTDSSTGKVKALVTYPSYDNNRLSGNIDVEYWEQLNNDASAPLYNQATQSLTAPGSTFKPLSAIAGLAEGVITTGTYIYDEGMFEEISPSPKCWIYPGSHGYINLAEALSVSCNYFYYTVGYNLGFEGENDFTYSSALGLERLEKYAIQVGLDMKSGIEIEESEPRFSTTDSVRTAIGQATNGFTTVQLGRYVNTLSQKGKNYQLSLVNEIKDKDGNIIEENAPVVTNTLTLTDDQWESIWNGMIGVTTQGTAYGIFDNDTYKIAGKTGTAQENLYRSNHATFIGFAPWDKPTLSFACCIRNGDSSTYPAEVCGDVLKFYYGELSLKDILNSTAKEITEVVSAD